eukprot:1079210-Rhodomonas_salina.2
MRQQSSLACQRCKHDGQRARHRPSRTQAQVHLPLLQPTNTPPPVNITSQISPCNTSTLTEIPHDTFTARSRHTYCSICVPCADTALTPTRQQLHR